MSVTINGKTYSGSDVSIVDGKVYIDGQLTDPNAPEQRTMKIVVEGMLQSLSVTRGDVECGDVGGSIHCDGSVHCRDVRESVEASGSVQCHNVTGSVKAGGSVNCGNVGGNLKAGGSIRHG